MPQRGSEVHRKARARDVWGRKTIERSPPPKGGRGVLILVDCQHSLHLGETCPTQWGVRAAHHWGKAPPDV